MRHGHQLGRQSQPVTERCGERGGQPVGTALDAVHAARPRTVFFRELIDECEERQLVGIGEKKAAQTASELPQRVVRVGFVQPLGDRSPREIGGDRRVPALLNEVVGRDQVGEAARQTVPAAGGRAAREARSSRSILPHVPPAVAQDARQGEAQLLAEGADLALGFVDQVAAGFRVLSLDEAVADGPHAAADALARVNHRDGGAERGQIARRGQPGEPGADDEDGNTVHRNWVIG